MLICQTSTIAATHRRTFSAEHGIGALHIAGMMRYKGQVELDLMLSVKRQLDPQNIMNPHRVLPPAFSPAGSIVR